MPATIVPLPARRNVEADDANRVREMMGFQRWLTWCRARGLDVYGAPGEEFAGPRPVVDADEEGC